MRPRSTVWRAASLAETSIENLIWEIPLNSRCATTQSYNLGRAAVRSGASRFGSERVGGRGNFRYQSPRQSIEHGLGFGVVGRCPAFEEPRQPGTARGHHPLERLAAEVRRYQVALRVTHGHALRHEPIGDCFEPFDRNRKPVSEVARPERAEGDAEPDQQPDL